MAAAPPSPRPPKAHRDGGDAPVTLFLDTDLGTRLALLVAPDTTIRGLKLQVDAEHAAAFPDLGPVAVKSFQVRRKGVLYHLSDSMTVTSAFTKIKGGCFLHVKMAEAAAVTRCCQDDGRRSSDGHLGIHGEKRVQELPALTSEIACDVLPQMLEGDAAATALIDVQAHDALPSSSQLNTEIKTNKAVGPSDTQAGCDPAIEKAKSYSSQIKHANQTEGAYIYFTSMENVDTPTNQSNISHVEEVHAKKANKEDILHGDGDNDVGGSVSDGKEVRIQEQMLADIHAMDNLSQEKERKKSTDHFDTPAPDPPRISNESDVGDLTKPSKDPLEAETTYHREPLNTSSQQEVQHTLHEDSTENTITVGKKKKRKRRQLAPFKDTAEETNEPSDGAKELPTSTGAAYDVETTGELVQFMHDAQASTDMISEQGKFDHALKECRNPSIGAPELVASEVGNPKGSITSWNGEDNHEQIKHDKGSHDDGVGEIKDTDKDGKSTDALEKRQTNDNTSQLKKRKKAKTVSSVDLVSVDTTHEKEMHGYRENVARSDTVSTEREIVHDPCKQHISINVHQGNPDIIENPNGDGKKKKKRRRQLKSSEFVANESSMHFTDGTPLDAKQTTPGGIEGATVIDHKDLGENLAVKDVIDEVLADLRSKDSSSKDLDEDMLTRETHLGSNKNALELPESTEGEVGVSVALPAAVHSDALPPKYPAAVHSDAPASSPGLKKSKEETMKSLSTMIDSSHHSSIVPKEDANRELNESDSLRFSDKASDPKDILTGDAVAQADGKPKGTKRQRKKVSIKQVPADNGKTLDEQVSHVDKLNLKGANATEANLVQGGSVVNTPLSTVSGKVEQKDRKSSKIRTAKVQETNGPTHVLDSHLAKDSQYEHENDVIGTHNNENAAGTATETPVVQKDGIALKSSSSSPNAQKAMKISSNSGLQSWDRTLEHGSSAELGTLRSEKNLIRPKDSAEPNPDAINFFDHFSSSKMNDLSVSVEHKQNDEHESLREVKTKKKIKRKQGTVSIEPNDALESLLPTDKSSLTGHFGTSSAIAPSVGAEKIQSEDKNAKNTKEKKRKRKASMEMPVTEKEIPHCDNQGIDIATQESHLFVIQKGRMGLNNEEERSSKVTQNSSIVPYELVDATLEKKLQQNAVDDQNKLLTDKDHEDASKDVRKSTSKIKPHAKSRHDESIKGRVASNPKPVRNLVKDFSTSPLVSSDSTEGTPQNANRFRVAIRKIPSKRYEQTREKSKKENRKVGSGAIFSDNINEGSDDELDIKDDHAFMEASPDNSATSGDSGISSAAYDDSDVPDEDGTVSLSQKSLKDGLHIGSILRGSRSYKKARRKQSELLDDDTMVPDSQPVDGLWD